MYSPTVLEAVDTEPKALIHKHHYSTSTDLDKDNKITISHNTSCSSKVVDCEDACFKISGIYPCDLQEALLESDKDHSKKIERNAACPTLNAYINNVKTHILIDTGAEISAISKNFIKINNKYFKNTVITR